MKFPKESNKYYLNELKHNITNYFTFNLKELHRIHKALSAEEIPPKCVKCSNYLVAANCQICHTSNDIGQEKKLMDKFVMKQNISEQKGSVKESIILCVDLSGSMTKSYPSKYKKVNEDLVSRILGPKNFEQLTKKLGVERVINNYSIIQTLLLEQSIKNIATIILENQKELKMNNGIMSEDKEIDEYITRKQIIEIAISKYIKLLKTRCPETLITIVYFNSTLEIPIMDFAEKTVIPDIQFKTLEEMIQLGADQADLISISEVSNVNDNLIMNLTGAKEKGQTAMTPALAFCFGLASKWKHSLHQIVVVTDGESNIGFGRTEDQLSTAQLAQTKKLFEKMAVQYAKPLNCVVNVITFEDCVISYDILDQIVGLTSGLPCQVTFEEIAGEQIITEKTIQMIFMTMIDSFVQFPKQFCYNSKISIGCNRPQIKFKINDSLVYKMKEIQNTNSYEIVTGIKSTSDTFKVEFYLPEGADQDINGIKFTILSQYERKNKRSFSGITEKIAIIKGNQEKGKKEEVKVMTNDIVDKLRNRELFEEDLKSYDEIEEKIKMNEQIQNQLDTDLLEKFKLKKQKMEELTENIDKLQMEKMSMQSRTYKTYKAKDLDDEDDD